MVLSLMTAIMMAVGAPSGESTVNISYNLPVGMSYNYQVVSDQYPIPQRRMRLHSMLNLVVLGVDAHGNRICRFKVTSDTTFDRTAELPTFNNATEVTGHRLFAKSGHVHFLLDMFGNVNPEETENEDQFATEISTQFLEQKDLYITPGAGTNSPYLPQLLMPSLPTSTFDVGRAYRDTVTIPSRTVVMPTSYGTSGKVTAEVLYDTVCKVTTLDSVSAYGPDQVAYMSLNYERHNTTGAVYRSESKIERSTNSGLIQYITENCYKMRGNKAEISYSALARLVGSQRLTPEQLRSYNMYSN